MQIPLQSHIASGAHFSPCEQYRYTLWRQWDASLPYALFVMLNPSTADIVANDPTVERCQRRAVQMGYGGLRVANIFALRSTDPAALYGHNDPVGSENDSAILQSAADAGIIVCGWGKHGALQDRGKQVLAMLRDAGLRPHYLKLNRDGSPGHPLYIGYAVTPVRF